MGNWNFGWDPKSNLAPLLESCASPSTDDRPTTRSLCVTHQSLLYRRGETARQWKSPRAQNQRLTSHVCVWFTWSISWERLYVGGTSAHLWSGGGHGSKGIDTEGYAPLVVGTTQRVSTSRGRQRLHIQSSAQCDIDSDWWGRRCCETDRLLSLKVGEEKE